MAGKKFRFTGTATRIRQKIEELGYEGPAEFWKAHREHYDRTTLYALCDTDRDRFPATYLTQLARDLGVTKGWILFGDETPPRRPARKLIAPVIILGLTIAGIFSPVKAQDTDIIDSQTAAYRKRRLAWAS